MSFFPENIPESPRMAPEKYGMYGNCDSFFFSKSNKDLVWQTMDIKVVGLTTLCPWTDLEVYNVL